MAEVKVKCPYCGSEEVVFYGKTVRVNNECSAKIQRVLIKLFNSNTPIMPADQVQKKKSWRW